MDYTVTLTEAQRKALEYIALDASEWINNAAISRSSNAMDEICAIYTNHKLDNNEAITVIGKDAMVLAAYSEGLIQSAAARAGSGSST
jgi:hypothetical protein